MIWRTTLAVVLAASSIGPVEAFTVTTTPAAKKKVTIASRGAIWALTATASTMTEEETDVFEQLGIEPGKLALGVRPDEVLKYIGTYVYHMLCTSNDGRLLNNTNNNGRGVGPDWTSHQIGARLAPSQFHVACNSVLVRTVH
jgi:hypothetical protein